MGNTKMLDWALKYAAEGFLVLPVNSAGNNPKAPNSSLAKNGVKNATDNAQIIKDWWERCPNANIGIAGSERLVIIDVDNKNGENGSRELFEWQKENNLILPETLTAKSGSGGYHYYYRLTEEQSREKFSNSVKILEGVDIRGRNSYVVAPPSSYPDGKIYEWENGFDPSRIAVANDAVMKLLTLKNDKTAAPTGDKDVERLLLEYMGLVISNIPGYLTKSALCQSSAATKANTFISALFLYRAKTLSPKKSAIR